MGGGSAVGGGALWGERCVRAAFSTGIKWGPH